MANRVLLPLTCLVLLSASCARTRSTQTVASGVHLTDGDGLVGVRVIDAVTGAPIRSRFLAGWDARNTRREVMPRGPRPGEHCRHEFALPAGGECIRISAEGYLETWSEPLRLRAESRTGGEIRMESLCRVRMRVRVFDRTGALFEEGTLLVRGSGRLTSMRVRSV